MEIPIGTDKLFAFAEVNNFLKLSPVERDKVLSKIRSNAAKDTKRELWALFTPHLQLITDPDQFTIDSIHRVANAARSERLVSEEQIKIAEKFAILSVLSTYPTFLNLNFEERC